MNSLKSTIVPQLHKAQVRAQKLVDLGRLNQTEVNRFKSKSTELIAFVEEMEEVEVNYGEASGDQAGE